MKVAHLTTKVPKRDGFHYESCSSPYQSGTRNLVFVSESVQGLLNLKTVHPVDMVPFLIRWKI